jgi:Zn-dependent M28 family amino/carboxypeptidase
MGAKAFIFGNHNPGQLPATGSLRPAYRMAGEIPAIGVSWETTSFILRQMEKGRVIARIKTSDRIIPDSTSWNVVGEVPGSTLRDRFIVVGAHFDGHDISQGAMDNASGACVVAEAARALAKFKGVLKRSLRFILFSAEELGVTGSTCYVAKHIDEMDRIDLMINCDGAGRAARHTFRVSGPPELVKILQEISREIEYPMRVETTLSTASDHWPFYMRSVPSASLASAIEPSALLQGRGFGHTSADMVDKVDHRGLKEGALILAQFLIRLANMETISRRMSSAEILEHLERTGVAEELRIQMKWHPDSPR